MMYFCISWSPYLGFKCRRTAEQVVAGDMPGAAELKCRLARQAREE